VRCEEKTEVNKSHRWRCPGFVGSGWESMIGEIGEASKLIGQFESSEANAPTRIYSITRCEICRCQFSDRRPGTPKRSKNIAYTLKIHECNVETDTTVFGVTPPLLPFSVTVFRSSWPSLLALVSLKRATTIIKSPMMLWQKLAAQVLLSISVRGTARRETAVSPS